jgi:hypothetical protein
VVVIGTSAGGLDALKSLFSAIPKDFQAPILVVMHLAPHIPSSLPKILSRYSQLPIVSPHQWQTLEAANIYVALPNLHNDLSKTFNDNIENALWAALRALEEKESLVKRIAEKMQEDESETANHFLQKATRLTQQVQTLHFILKDDLDR